jgi:hypothetical protein
MGWRTGAPTVGEARRSALLSKVSPPAAEDDADDEGVGKLKDRGAAAEAATVAAPVDVEGNADEKSPKSAPGLQHKGKLDINCNCIALKCKLQMDVHPARCCLQKAILHNSMAMIRRFNLSY